MTERHWRSAVWSAALGVLLIGAVLGWRTRTDLRAHARRLERKREELAEARALYARRAGLEAAAAALRALPDGHPAPLDGLLAAPGAQKPDDSREEAAAAPGGWRVWRHELVFRDAPLADVMDWVCRAEAANGSAAGRAPVRPPWRLERLAFTASPRAPGRGRIVVALEAVEREDAR
ncbi:MAG: hypothetical protein JW951_00250 [Lentisphaerae bacterium]|nr:hypothetical protein [Lentisphaerota bacterium]